MSDKDREFEDFTIININSDNDIAALAELPRPERVCSVFKATKGVVAVIAELVEGGAIGYAVYLIIDNVEEWVGLWGYALVGVGGAVTGTAQLVKQIPTSSQPQQLGYALLPNNERTGRQCLRKSIAGIKAGHLWAVNHAHHYHLFLESLVGGLVIGHYFSELAPTELAAFGVDLGVALAATALSFTARMFDYHQRLPIYLKVPAYLIFGGALGFGIGDLLLDNIEGFGVIVPTWAHWMTLAPLGLLNMFAQLSTLSGAKFMRSGFHGLEVALFFAILMFDMLEDLRNSDDFSNTDFALIYASAVLLWVLSTAVHHTDELRHHSAAGHDDTDHNLPTDSMNEPSDPGAQVEILEEDIEENSESLAAQITHEQPAALAQPTSSELAKSLTKILNSEVAPAPVENILQNSNDLLSNKLTPPPSL